MNTVHIAIGALIGIAVFALIEHKGTCNLINAHTSRIATSMAYALQLKPGVSGNWFPGSEYGGT